MSGATQQEIEQFFMQMPLQQMQSISNQFQQELTMLTESFGQLKAAQGRFLGSMASLEVMKPDNLGM